MNRGGAREDDDRTPRNAGGGGLLAALRGNRGGALRGSLYPPRYGKGAAYAANMVHNYSFQPQEHEEAEQKMRAAAAGLTELDRELLGRL